MSKNKRLMAKRHTKRDLFICEMSDAVLKDDMASMEHPIFALSTKPDKNIRRYDHNNKSLEIWPSAIGIATIFDKDILIYAISKLMEAKKNGQPYNRKVHFAAHDFLVFSNRMVNGNAYEGLKSALARLDGTRLRTNLKTGNTQQWEAFGLIDGAMIKRSDETGRVTEWGITISEWLFNAIEADEVLTLHSDYFRLRKPLERRVYELGRKHCGLKNTWKINLELLQKKSGSLSPLKHFKYLIKDIIKNDHLPDYHLSMDERDNVIFTRKQESKVGELTKSKISPSGPHYTVDTLDRFLDTKAQDKCPKLARDKGIDYYFLKNEFCNFLNTKGAPDNISASFIGFIKQKKIV